MSFALQAVSFRYDPASADVLAGLSLELPDEAVIAVLGMSGSGKTTLLNLLGLLWERNPTAGCVSYTPPGGARRDYASLGAAARAELRRQYFGFVLQSAYLLPQLSCAENVEVPLALTGEGEKERRKRAETLLGRAGLSGRAAASARDISGGEKQRVAVLRAIAHNPEVVFADEPLSNLDPHNSRLVLDLLREWQAGSLEPADGRRRTLVLVTHDFRAAWDVADHFLLLRQGRAVEGRLLTKADLPDGPEQIERLIDPTVPQEAAPCSAI